MLMAILWLLGGSNVDIRRLQDGWKMADGRKVKGGGTDGYSYVARLLKKWTTGILMAILTLQGCYRRW